MTTSLSPTPISRDFYDTHLAQIVHFHESARGKTRVDPYIVLNAILYHELTGCRWSRVPHQLDDSTLNRTYHRWRRSKLLYRLYAAIIEHSQSTHHADLALSYAARSVLAAPAAAHPSRAA